VGACVLLAIGIRGDIDNAQIDAEPIMGIFRRRFRDIDNDRQIEHAIAIEKVSLPSQASQAGGLVATKDGLDKDSSSQCQDRDTIQCFPGEDALIVDNGAMLAKRRLYGPIPLIRFANLCDGSNGQLGGKSEVSSDLMIDELLKFDFVGGALSESHGGDGIARGIEAFHRVEEHPVLVRGWDELNHECQIHVLNATITWHGSQERRGSRADVLTSFPPRYKCLGLPGGFIR
jgi:hypothetical protein